MCVNMKIVFENMIDLIMIVDLKFVISGQIIQIIKQRISLPMQYWNEKSHHFNALFLISEICSISWDRSVKIIASFWEENN